MRKYTYKKIDIDIYEHICKNGLTLYLIPNKNFKSFFATLNVKFGSNILKFKKGEEIVELPKGTAHFLEHKMFEQEDGLTPFEFYSKRGVNCNASTSNDKTDYIFSGDKDFKENLNYLLDYVASPYFTDENVEKEKGIISQELLMYEDEASMKLYTRSLFNTYLKNNIRYSVGGKVKDILKINKEILSKAYDAFYRPSNMFLVITGSFDIKETIKLVDSKVNNQISNHENVEIINATEPYGVLKKYEEITGNVLISKFAINIKINVKKLKGKIPKYSKYLYMYLENRIGSTSTLKEELIGKKLITSDLEYDIIKSDDYCSIMIFGETNNYKEVITKIMNELEIKKISNEEFILSQKVLKSSYVYMSDNIYSVNNFLVNQIIEYGQIDEKIYENIDKMDKQEYNEVISVVDLTNYSVVIINPNM